MIVHRGTELDADAFVKIARSKKFTSSNARVKQSTLEKYFDVATLFGAFTPDTLPTRNILTYLPVENGWRKTFE